MDQDRLPKPLIWIGTSLRDLRTFPEPVRDHVGYALYVAQRGGRHRSAKTLTGFGGAGVVEVVTDHRTDTFRAVYTLRYSEAVYVLHAFQKKSKIGRKTTSRLLKKSAKRDRQIDPSVLPCFQHI